MSLQDALDQAATSMSERARRRVLARRDFTNQLRNMKERLNKGKKEGQLESPLIVAFDLLLETAVRFVQAQDGMEGEFGQLKDLVDRKLSIIEQNQTQHAIHLENLVKSVRSLTVQPRTVTYLQLEHIAERYGIDLVPAKVDDIYDTMELEVEEDAEVKDQALPVHQGHDLRD